MGKMVQYWAYYKVNLHSLHYDVWSELDSRIPNHYQKETNTHLTIHPRFQFPVGEEERFEHYIYETFPRHIKIDLTDFYYHPRENKPMVICIEANTNINFQERQRELTRKIEENGGKNVIEPAPPHITMYKSRDKGGQFRKIPTNVNEIKTRCKKVSQDKLPITVHDTELHIDKTR